jgi:hypothetical protein
MCSDVFAFPSIVTSSFCFEKVLGTDEIARNAALDKTDPPLTNIDN